MNLAEATIPAASDGIAVTRERSSLPQWNPFFLGDWMRAVFIHYEVEPAALQREIPYELDLFEGRAFVSLVAFTMQRLRPRRGGRLAELFFSPFATTRYLNVRTYVRHRNSAGIYFIAEFLSNPFCVPLGRPTFGLPYRFGLLAYGGGGIEVEVMVSRGSEKLTCHVSKCARAEFRTCLPETLDAFLLERYVAFTCCGQARRFFHIWHLPWSQVSVEVSVRDEGLLATTGRWIKHARFVGANFSPGVCDVGMEWPRRIQRLRPKRRLTAFFNI
jgi:uncharacterized protein YqjF (DUF2071 family)